MTAYRERMLNDDYAKTKTATTRSAMLKMQDSMISKASANFLGGARIAPAAKKTTTKPKRSRK